MPPDQARTIYKALKEKGLPVALVEYEGEQHGLRKVENKPHSSPLPRPSTSSPHGYLMDCNFFGTWFPTGREHQVHPGAADGVLCPISREI